MIDLKFIKDHPSRRFKKGDIVQMPKENIDAWIKSGYAVESNKETGDDLGNVETSSEDGGQSKENLINGGGSQKKSSKKNKKKRGGK